MVLTLETPQRQPKNNKSGSITSKKRTPTTNCRGKAKMMLLIIHFNRHFIGKVTERSCFKAGSVYRCAGVFDFVFR
jgi:hypothetical protein